MWRVTFFAVAVSQSAPELEHYRLLTGLRARGYTCQGGRVFPPNPAEFAFDCRAWVAARAHSQDMAARKYFARISPEGKSPCDRTLARGLAACSENIAAGQATAQAALDAWKASGEHCPNMLDPALNRVGVGYASGGPYKHYWTQNMGTASSLDSSCVGGSPAKPTCEDRNAACAAYAGYAGTPWCGDAQGGWAKTNCPKTCGLC